MTILYAEQLMAVPWWYGPLVFVIMAGLVFGGLYLAANDRLEYLIALALIFPTLGLFAVGEQFVRSETGQWKYKVIFDDSYAINEAYANYKVISVEGKIFTIISDGELEDGNE